MADWGAEAARAASSRPLSYGVALEARPVPEEYVLSGSKLWGQAKATERVAVVEAFATNTVVQRVDMVNTQAGDALGQAWGCLLYTSPSPRDRTRSRMPSSA